MDGIRQLSAVTGVLLLMGAFLWWLRRRGLVRLDMLPRRPRQRHMEVLERLALGPQHSLHLIRVAGRVMVVGVSPAGCQVLQCMDDGQLGAGGLIRAREANG